MTSSAAPSASAFAPYRRLDVCRICGDDRLRPVLSLGDTPLANAFVRPEQLDAPEPRFPLEVVRCERCELLQLSVVVRPDILFRRYAYSSSASTPMASHWKALAEEVAGRTPPGRLVVEIGSNDGALLRQLRSHGVTALGVEPATNLARLANDEGLETWNQFFDEVIARQIVRDRGRAGVVVGNNVLAHIDDLPMVVRSLDAVLEDDGAFIAEVPYLIDLLDRLEYDTIYHEHLSYFHLAPLRALFRQTGLELFDVRRLPVHGGSIRIYVARAGRAKPTPELEALLRRERERGLAEAGTWETFAGRVAASRDELRSLLARLKANGKVIAAYGATAKGNTLLNYCGIGTETLEYVADSTPFKQGLLTPGAHVPVVAEDAVRERRPDFALLLAWNYADNIIARHVGYVVAGGRFVHPIPSARILPS